MDADFARWELLAGWAIVIMLVGGVLALLQRRHRRDVLPRPRPDHGVSEDADRRRLQADLAARSPDVELAPTAPVPDRTVTEDDLETHHRTGQIPVG